MDGKLHVPHEATASSSSTTLPSLNRKNDASSSSISSATSESSFPQFNGIPRLEFSNDSSCILTSYNSAAEALFGMTSDTSTQVSVNDFLIGSNSASLSVLTSTIFEASTFDTSSSSNHSTRSNSLESTGERDKASKGWQQLKSLGSRRLAWGDTLTIEVNLRQQSQLVNVVVEETSTSLIMYLIRPALVSSTVDRSSQILSPSSTSTWPTGQASSLLTSGSPGSSLNKATGRLRRHSIALSDASTASSALSTTAPPPLPNPLQGASEVLMKAGDAPHQRAQFLQTQDARTLEDVLSRVVVSESASPKKLSQKLQKTRSIGDHAYTHNDGSPTSIDDSPTDHTTANAASTLGTTSPDTPSTPPSPEYRKLSVDEMEQFLSVLPILLFKGDANGMTSWFNNAWYEYTGLTATQSKDLELWSTLFDPEQLPYVLGIWGSSIKNGAPFAFEYTIRGHDGIMRWFKAHGAPKKDEDDKIVSWAFAVTNIDDQVRERFQAQTIRENVKAVLSGGNLVLLSVDANLNVTFFEGEHELCRRLAGPENTNKNTIELGLPLSEIWPDPELSRAAQSILDGRESKAFVNLKRVGVLEEDIIWVRFRLMARYGGPGFGDDELSGVSIIGIDVTEISRVEEALHQAELDRTELKASETAAREASRLKTEFLTTVSHEIRTPISAILGICELLLDDDALHEMQRSLIRKAVRSGEILLDLVGMVLDVRKVESGELKLESTPFELESVIADARLFSVIAHKKNISFVEKIGRFYEATLLGDRLRLRQVLTNALSNSVKFTEKGGITFKVTQASETDEDVWITFTVADTGIGISKEVLPSLFQPFRQADASTARKYGGSGLGLVIARTLVELMGGSIELTSELGKGTIMTIKVPFKKASFEHRSVDGKGAEGEEARIELEKRQEANGIKAEDVKILLAEDNDLIREIVTRTLVKMKFNVTAVEDGAKAVAAIEAKPFDLILMDGQMPGLDGYEATARIRKSKEKRVRETRIIALTASAIQGDKERCLQAGMDSYLAKPVRAQALEAEIWRMLSPRSP